MRWRLALVAFVCAVLYCVAAVPQSNVIGGGIYGDAKNGGITYYVANGGSDSNNGLTPATAWQTITHVNAQTLAAGTTVLFNGGQTFTGGIALTTTNAPSGGVTIGSYGTGQATISSTTSACLTDTDVPGIIIENIACTGSGDTTNTTNGIYIINDSASASMAGSSVSGVTVSGYGGNGILFYGSGGFGFTNPSVVNSTVYDVGGNASNTGSGTGIAITTNSTTNITANSNCKVTGNTVYDVIGTSGTYSGSGIFVNGCTGLEVGSNLVHDSGSLNATSAGPVGIILALDSGPNCVVEKNEVYNQSTASADGEGFDFDWSVSGCTERYNYSHGNVSGYFFYNFSNSGNPAWSNNLAYFNISQNNTADEFRFGTPSAAISSSYVFNNTFFHYGGGKCITQISSGSTVAITFSNNICYSIAGSSNLFVNISAPSSLVFTGNDYWGNATFTWNGTNYPGAVGTAFANWQTASGQEKISGSNVGVTKEPRLVVYGGGGDTGGYVPASLTEYQLQTSSPMIGAGIDVNANYGVAYPSTDYFGAAITSAAKLIGAGQTITWTSGTGTCPQATGALGRLSSPPTATQEQTNALVCGAVIDGWYSLEDGLWKLATDSATDAAINLANANYNLVVTQTETFTANLGYTGDGSTGLLTANGLDPATIGGNCTQNSCGFSAYVTNSRTGSTLAYSEISAGTGTNPVSGFCPACLYSSGGMFGFVNENVLATNFSINVAQAQGDWLVNRTGANTETAYLNGVLQTLSGGTGSSTGLPTTVTIGNPSADTIAYADWGASKTAIQALLESWRFSADCQNAISACPF